MGCCLSLLGLSSKPEDGVELAPGNSSSSSSLRRGNSTAPPYHLDKRGSKVRVEREVIGGEGLVIASVPLEQDAAYWEVKVIKGGGVIALGVSRKLDAESMEIAKLPDNNVSWGVTVGCGAEPQSEECKISVEEGEVIGCVFSQSEFPMLRFYTHCEEVFAVDRVRGLVYPAVSVSGGAKVQFIFGEDEFVEAPPSSRFQAIMLARDMI